MLPCSYFKIRMKILKIAEEHQEAFVLFIVINFLSAIVSNNISSYYFPKYLLL